MRLFFNGFSLELKCDIEHCTTLFIGDRIRQKQLKYPNDNDYFTFFISLSAKYKSYQDQADN